MNAYESGQQTLHESVSSALYTGRSSGSPGAVTCSGPAGDTAARLQALIDNSGKQAAQCRQAAAVQANRTGLPAHLKSAIEAISHYNMDKVQVHYNSPEPAALQAYAFTRGMDIYIAPGKKQHLAHEAWHVVQQLQGRVQPTIVYNAALINDNPALEQEADLMGKKVLDYKHLPGASSL